MQINFERDVYHKYEFPNRFVGDLVDINHNWGGQATFVKILTCQIHNKNKKGEN